ncbi:MAG: hypothetical protein RBR35_03105 [Salinivirgaceae bacterium]|nr:hypothetical protein [Salinivirgaceae bacterium]
MILYLIFLVVIVWMIGKIPFFTKSNLKPFYIRSLFLLKVAVGFVILFIYSNYYPKETSDIHNYFNDAEILYSSLERSPADFFAMLSGFDNNQPHLMEYYDSMAYWIKPFDYNLYNDNKVVIRLNAFIRLFSNGDINIHSLFFNLLSFFGLMGIFRFLMKYIEPSRRVLIAIAVFLIPSVLFWGSGILKESVLLFALGLFVWSIDRWTENYRNIPRFILALAMGFLFFHVKIYVVLSLIPALIWLVSVSIFKRFRVAIFIAIHLVLVLIAFNIQHFGVNFNLLELIANKQHDFINMITQLTVAGSAIELPIMDGTLWGFIKAIPVGILNALFRPHVFEWHNIVSFAAALENLFIVGAIAFLCFTAYAKRISSIPFLFGVSFSLILLTIIGVTTPVLGALVRYKMPALPFLLSVFIVLMNREKTLKITSFLRSNWIIRFFKWLDNTCFA